MALSFAHILKFETPAGLKVQGTLTDLFGLLTGAIIKQRYEGEADTNAFTDAEKTKLAGLTPSLFRGTFLTETALNLVVGGEGQTANVDGAAGEDVTRYIWDVNDSKWVEQSGSVAALTGAQIKTLYEGEPDTNAYTNADAAKVANISITGPVDLDNVAAEQALNSSSRHDAVTLAPETGFVLTGQELSNDYSALPPC